MTGKQDRKRGLGRGLSALMADVSEAETSSGNMLVMAERRVPIEQIFPNPDQPRKQFTEQDLEDLAASIRKKGVIQPLIVRQTAENQFEIVAGERRWRASQLANLHELPIIVRDFTDAEVLEVAIIENIQRADLNAVEEAAGYRQLMDKFGHTQEKMAEALGKSRSHIANLLRLLNLPEAVLEMLRTGDLSAGHARALIPAGDPLGLARQVIKGGLSVRATEALVRKDVQGSGGAKDQGPVSNRGVEKDADTRTLEGDLSATLGMGVTLSHKQGEGGGQLVVTYKDLNELDALCRLLSGS